jgi:hypothetical protein
VQQPCMALCTGSAQHRLLFGAASAVSVAATVVHAASIWNSVGLVAAGWRLAGNAAVQMFFGDVCAHHVVYSLVDRCPIFIPIFNSSACS